MNMARNLDDQSIPRIIGCSSDFELGSFLGDFEVDGFKGLTSLKADPADLDAKAKRAELIESVLGGKHLELRVKARTFRQEPKVFNARFVKLGGDLVAQVPSFIKQPFLLDHDTYRQSSRKGTILTASVVEETRTRVAFEMGFEVVKPETVISVLDGTLDRFSIAWHREGPVLCTVHNCDVTLPGSCDCWPGDVVLVDGKSVTAEYLFTKWRGKEMSGTNFPAVRHTNIEDIKAALAAELDLPPARRHKPNQETNRMRFPRLQQFLGLALAEEPTEDTFLTAVEALRGRATAAETRATAAEARAGVLQTSLSQAETALRVTTANANKIQVDHLLTTLGYEAGKLIHTPNPADPSKPGPSPMEHFLRQVAATPTVLATESSPAVTGLDLLRMQLRAMPQIAKVNRPLQADEVVGPPLMLGADDDNELYSEDNEYLREACAQTGVDIKAAVRFANANAARPLTPTEH
jgi:hypothetical protein